MSDLEVTDSEDDIATREIETAVSTKCLVL